MISNEVTKFMAIVPLMLPRLIDSKRCVDPDITEDTAVLYFKLDEPFPIGCVMDMLDENVELHLLYHSSNKTDEHFHHCCFFASPKLGHCMFSINMTTNKNTFVEGLSVTVYDSIDVWEDELEKDLELHAKSFDFVKAMTPEQLLSIFCKMDYEG